jgi:hypothetical protein
MIKEDVRELHYVVKYNMETKAWEIDWDVMEARFDEGNYYESRGGWTTLPHEFEDTIIQDLNVRISNDR